MLFLILHQTVHYLPLCLHHLFHTSSVFPFCPLPLHHSYFKVYTSDTSGAEAFRIKCTNNGSSSGIGHFSVKTAGVNVWHHFSDGDRNMKVYWHGQWGMMCLHQRQVCAKINFGQQICFKWKLTFTFSKSAEHEQLILLWKKRSVSLFKQWKEVEKQNQRGTNHLMITPFGILSGY